jgi:PEP-CTERM motif
MGFKMLAAGAALALSLMGATAHAQTAASSVDYTQLHGPFTITDNGPDVLNVNPGDSITVTGDWSAVALNTDDCPACNIQLYLAGLPGLPVQADLYNSIIFSNQSGTYSLTFDAPTTAGTYYLGGATTLEHNFIGVSGGANGDSLVNYQINVTQPVPEPATWAMMLVGFGGLGALLRNHRRALMA